MPSSWHWQRIERDGLEKYTPPQKPRPPISGKVVILGVPYSTPGPCCVHSVQRALADHSYGYAGAHHWQLWRVMDRVQEASQKPLDAPLMSLTSLVIVKSLCRRPAAATMALPVPPSIVAL